MSCGWNRRRASERTALATALVVLAVAAWAAPPSARKPLVEVASTVRVTPEVRDLIAQDGAWLRQQPETGLRTPPPDTSAAAVAVWLRGQRPGGGAAGDTALVRGGRDLLSRLHDRWQAQGYLGATVTLAVPADSTAPPTLIVDPGPVYHYGRVDVDGPDFPDRARLVAGLLPRTGDRVRARELDAAVARLLQAVGERGHPFPSWVVRDVTLDPTEATVALAARLIPGPRAVVGPQLTNLPAGRGSDFLLRTAGLPSGEPLRESELDRGLQRLLARGLYERVEEPSIFVTTSTDTVGVLWRVVPRRRPNRLSVLLGLSQRPGETTSRLSGSVDLNLPNLAGTGRALAARWSDDGAQQSRFGFSYLEPLVAGTPLDVEVALDQEVERDAYTRFRLDNRWRLPVVALWGIEVGFGWDRTTYPEGDLQRTSRRRGRAAVWHHRGDEATSGWTALFAVETAQRSSTLRTESDSTATTGSALGSAAGQRLLEGDLGGELWLGEGLSLAGRAALRQIDSGVRPVPLSEQYRFGGATTLRGYRENEFHGETVAFGGVELRLGRAHGSRVYTFVDLGYFDFAQAAADSTTEALVTREGRKVGFGLGLMARAAPGEINLAIGFPGSVDFTSAKLHVALLGSF